MSTKKIKHHDAERIAQSIAATAFKHIIDPLTEKLKQFTQGYYDGLLQNNGLTPQRIFALREAGVFDQNKGLTVRYETDTGSINIYLGCIGRWTEHGYVYDGEPGDFIKCTLEIPGSAINAIRSDLEALIETDKKASTLCRTLTHELLNRTVKQAVAAWPEAAQFIYKEMQVTAPAPMVAPLEELIGRFMLALPAPTEKEVA